MSVKWYQACRVYDVFKKQSLSSYVPVLNEEWALTYICIFGNYAPSKMMHTCRASRTVVSFEMGHPSGGAIPNRVRCK